MLEFRGQEMQFFERRYGEMHVRTYQLLHGAASRAVNFNGTVWGGEEGEWEGVKAHLCRHSDVYFCGNSRTPEEATDGTTRTMHQQRHRGLERRQRRTGDTHLAQPLALRLDELVRGAGLAAGLAGVLGGGHDGHAREVAVHAVGDGAGDVGRDGDHLESIGGRARHARGRDCTRGAI